MAADVQVFKLPVTVEDSFMHVTKVGNPEAGKPKILSSSLA